MTREKLAVMLLAMLLASCVVLGGCKGGARQATAPTAAQPPAAQQPAPTEGAQGASEKTPVVIEAYYPLNESHKFIADYLEEIGKANPGKVKVTVYDMQSEEGRRKWAASGLSCAGVFVNGSTRHEITKDGKTETVDFLQRMDVFWSHQDFETVVKGILEKAGEKFTPPAKEPSAAKPQASAAEQPTKAGESAKASEKPQTGR